MSEQTNNYDYGWDWGWIFVRHFARKMRDLNYSPWYVASNLAEAYEFLDEQEKKKKREKQQSTTNVNITQEEWIKTVRDLKDRVTETEQTNQKLRHKFKVEETE